MPLLPLQPQPLPMVALEPAAVKAPVSAIQHRLRFRPHHCQVAHSGRTRPLALRSNNNNKATLVLVQQ
jgi:hypothetical protein